MAENEKGPGDGFGDSGKSAASIERLFSIISKSPLTPLNDKQLTAEIKHARGKQDLSFRPRLFWSVVSLMIIEVLALFVVVFFQGFGSVLGHPFHLDQWVLTSINAGILLQTFGLAKIIAKALFKES